MHLSDIAILKFYIFHLEGVYRPICPSTTRTS